MNPIYRFTLSADDGTSQIAYPIYSGNLAKEYEKESGEEFFRASLSGELTFEGPDYKYIKEKEFDAQMGILIEISYDGTTFSEYWRGKFFKVDCAFDEDSETIKVKPSVDDKYGLLLAGMDKEYNLIELAPEIDEIRIDKRPMVQVYALGDSVVGCFLSGMWWEQECQEITNPTQLEDMHFALNQVIWKFVVSGTFSPELPDLFFGTSFNFGEDKNYINGDYYLEYISADSASYKGYFSIKRVSDDVALWDYYNPNSYLPTSMTLTPVVGHGATGNVVLERESLSVYTRLLLDKDKYFNLDTYDIPANDIVENNRNYHKCIGYGLSNVIFFSDHKTTTPTQWGIYQPGLYYIQPWILGRPIFPIARSAWGLLSYWFAFATFDDIYEEEGRKEYVLKDAYPLSSAISKVLGKIAPGITHADDPSYSEFLYDENPISGYDSRLFLVPKSNILKGEYDQPAQKAPVTLRQITDMLRDCFRCFWFLDGNKFRIEHIEYFRNGGNYDGSPDVGVDLTDISVSRSGKKWAFAKNAYSFDSAEIPSRMEFGWMDDVTSPFEGEPIDLISKYAKEGNVEKITIQQFTSDVDYMLLNPSACSSDGFGLLEAVDDGGTWKLPYYQSGDSILQNGLLSFAFLQQFYMYDLAAPHYTRGIHDGEAIGTKKLRMQDISFPCYEDPNLQKLVKSDIGEGNYEKLSINLSSRMGKATLRYDTE